MYLKRRAAQTNAVCKLFNGKLNFYSNYNNSLTHLMVKNVFQCDVTSTLRAFRVHTHTTYIFYTRFNFHEEQIYFLFLFIHKLSYLLNIKSTDNLQRDKNECVLLRTRGRRRKRREKGE